MQTNPGTPSYSNAKIIAAYQLLNLERASAGLGVVLQSASLDAAADGHSNYLGINNDLASDTSQIGGRSAFTGATTDNRVGSAGYNGAPSEAAVGFQNTATDGIRAVLSTAYLRMSLLHHGVKDIGLGFVEPGTTRPASATPVINDGLYSSLVMTSGLLTGQLPQAMQSFAAEVSVYPPSGAVDVPVMMYRDLPNPVAAQLGPWAQGAFPGYAVSLQVPSTKVLSVALFSLTQLGVGGNTAVPVRVLDQTDATFLAPRGIKNWATMVPLSPLAVSGTYEATFIGVSSGQPVVRTWRFTTRSGWTASTARRDPGSNRVVVNYTSPSGILSVGAITPQSCGAGYNASVRVGQQSITLIEGSIRPLASCNIEFSVGDLGTGLVDIRTIAVN